MIEYSVTAPNDLNLITTSQTLAFFKAMQPKAADCDKHFVFDLWMPHRKMPKICSEI